ncbi:sulfatase-like hydrolase/transferase [Planctomycetes bacterium CA13]
MNATTKLLTIFCVLAPLGTNAVFAAPLRPNIVVVMCDDLGYSDVGFNGATDIRTPELDALAKSGTICTSAYVPHPFCGPSRMGLMSGRYPHEFGAPFNLPNSGHGIEEYNKQGIDINETLISTVLQDAGYYTGAIGKWHMGITQPFHPNTRGFDDFYGFLGGGHSYFPEKYRPIYERQRRAGNPNINEYSLPLEHNGEEVNETQYITDALSREAVRFVNDAAKKDQPFFLFLAYNAPHTPLEAKEDDLKEYADVKDEKRRTYAAMVHAVDRGVGEVVESLKSNHEFDDTLIIFLSDNGGKTSAGATNRPLAQGKGSVYEGGYRVPMFFHWPGHVPAGKRFKYPVSSLDFYPTFAGLGGGTIPAGKHLDGKDIWNDFLAAQNPRKGDMIFVVRHRAGFSDASARQDRWKVLRDANGPWKLFNIEDDVSEQHDLSAQNPELLHSMVAKMEKWSRSHIEPRWHHERQAKDQWDETGMPHFDQTFSIDPSEATPVEVSEMKPLKKGDSTRDDFVEREREKWEKNGWNWDHVKVDKMFDSIDANKDGVASGEEKKAYWAKMATEN